MGAKTGRTLAVALVALVALLALAPVGGAASASLASLVRGGLQLDVRSSGGALLGTVHASVAATGKGIGAFRAAAGQQRPPVIVAVRGSLQGTTARLALRGKGLQATLTVGAGGAATGTGALGGTAVRLSGVASDATPTLRRGMRMLVVGAPSGEAWEALRTYFTPVAYDPALHARARLLQDRDEFHRYAAIVFGAGVSASSVRAHALLHLFANAGKWVILAPATEARLDALAGVHPYDPNEDVPAIAVRSTGAEGDYDRVKPAVVYPDASATVQTAAAAARRKAWFLGQLTRLGKGQLATARTTSAARTPQSGTTFSLPYNAAAIELAVSYYHEYTVGGAQNAARLDACGWNQDDGNAWCSDTWYWGELANDYSDPTLACTTFLAQKYWYLAAASAHSVAKTKNKDGAYGVDPNDLGTGFYLKNTDACPQEGTQTGNIQGTDYYYAIYDPNAQLHTLVALTDPTVSASSSGKLFRSNASNGSGHYTRLECLQCPFFEASLGLKETAWFLGAYVHTLSLSGPNVGDLNFEYSGSQSYPNNEITVADASSGTSYTSGISVGVFGDQGTVTYSASVTTDASVSVQVPDWSVNPTPQGRSVTYSWETGLDGNGQPLTWQTMATCCAADGAGASFVPNDLNVDDFSPASLTVWVGAPTYGPVTITSTRTLELVDHYSVWDQDEVATDDFFAVKPIVYGDAPNTITPKTTSPDGPGIDLCDPAVMDPDFALPCGKIATLVPSSGS